MNACIIKDKSGEFACYEKDKNFFMNFYKDQDPILIETLEEQELYKRIGITGFIIVPEDVK